MLDQLIIENKYSLDDFDFSVKERSIGMPDKKEIKDTVPFSNKTYDFSAINGEIYWEERKLDYIFECIKGSPAELEEAKTVFSNWVMSVQEAKIYDPYILDYHFIGTFDSIKYSDEDSMEKTTVTVTFSAYPYKIANLPKKYSFTLAASGEVSDVVINNSSHRMIPTITSDVSIVINMDNTSYAIPSGETIDDTLMLPVGKKKITIQNSEATTGTVTISFYEEVF